MNDRTAPVPEAYVVADIQDALAHDGLAELGVEVVVAEGTLVLLGRVSTPALCEAVAQVAAMHAPGYEIRNDLQVLEVDAPPGAPEQLR